MGMGWRDQVDEIIHRRQVRAEQAIGRLEMAGNSGKPEKERLALKKSFVTQGVAGFYRNWPTLSQSHLGQSV